MRTPAPEYLTTREAARLLRVLPDTVRGWVRDGVLPAVKLPGGGLRIVREDLFLVLLPARRPGGDR